MQAANGSHPVFVGGTGRSGTTMLGQLIGSHPKYAFLPVEAKFHCHPRGLPGVLAGDVSTAAFIRYMRDEWYPDRARQWADPTFPGRWENWRAAKWPFRENVIEIPWDRLDTALDRFSREFPMDGPGASRHLVRSLLDPIAAMSAKRSWVETTPSNGSYAATLSSIFPEMRLVHVVRDGRDVASSRLARGRRRDDPRSRTQDGFEKEIRWWARRLRSTDEAVRSIPSERTLTVHLEHLVEFDREATYRRLLDFLSLEDRPEIRSTFEGRVTAGRAHIGRWLADGHLDRERAQELYREALADLRANGVTCVPDYDLTPSG